MKQRKIDVEKARQAFMNQKEKSSGSFGNYISLEKDETRLRLLPNFIDPEESPSVKLRVHTYKINGRLENGLEWAWLANSPYAEIALETGKITREELELAEKYGDPFTVLATKFKDFDEKVPSGLWAKTTFLFNVIKRGAEGDEVGILRMSQQLADMLGSLLEEFPEAFDPSDEGFDIKITGNKKDGLQRRYTGVTIVREPIGLGNDDIEDEVYNLANTVVSNVRDYRKKVDEMFMLYGDDAARFGMSPSDFGA